MKYLENLQSIAQSLFDALENPMMKEMWSVWGYKSDLKKLQETANKINDLLLDAEHMQGQLTNLSHQDQSLVRNLKHLIYDVDDLVQTFVAHAEQRQLKAQEEGSSSIVTKVRRLFSFQENPFVEAFRWSGEVKEIVGRLDTIVQDHNRLGLKCQWEPVHRIREETDSRVYDYEIIGRDNEVEEVVDRLVDDRDVECDVSYYNIVGMGGLGKTAIANKVYNDPRIEAHFSLRLWACVSDEDPDHLDVKATLGKILKSVPKDKSESCSHVEDPSHLSLEQVQRKVQELLEGKKYLLILDDVWTENREQWIQLRKHFQGGLKGSWIVVTTRSEKTAKVVGDEHTLKLKGLSDDDSWRLFMSVAFEPRSEQELPPDLIEIGQRIVTKCANVPLAIRVVGGLLYGQGKQKWLAFGEQIEFGGIEQGRNGGIKPILELSYLHLPTQLKMCFSYCSLFPKDHIIKKKTLIYLWWAQGFIGPLYDGQTIEDAGEECFSILASRSFFQDIHNFEGRISFKLHDLMHDIAQGVVDKEIYAGNSIPAYLNERVRHLCLFASSVETESFFTGTKIRTFLQMKKSDQGRNVGLWCHNEQHLSTLLANWVCLRALDLSSSGIKDMPSTVGKLVLLRYLDLSWNHDIKELPDSITGLHNLEILLLKSCSGIEKLPEDLSKLTKLRVLDTSDCSGLKYMPSHMGWLTCLEKLPRFVVGDRSSCERQRRFVDQLQELKALKNIKGDLCILQKATFALEKGEEGGFLSQHQYLTNIHFNSVQDWFDEASLEKLRPHPNLTKLSLTMYVGERMPNWAREHNLVLFLPNLTSLTLYLCKRLQHLSGIGKLPKLKSLRLSRSSSLEYIENSTINSNSFLEVLESQELFFPSLEHLKLYRLNKLRGWWRDDDSPNQQDGGLLPSFPRLSHLEIEKCPMLASMPYCPSLEDLKVFGNNGNLRLMESMERGNSKLKCVETSDVMNLKLILPIQAFQCLQSLKFNGDGKVESLSDVGELFLNCSSSLQHLEIIYCSKLKSLSGGLKHLTALKTLELGSLPNVSLSKEGEGEEEEIQGMPWRCLAHSLRDLTLCGLDEVVKLPNGMRYLTALQTLKIWCCEKLERVPEWMPELTSLKTLNIVRCSSSLHERCRNPTGEDWPYIQNIPNVYLNTIA